MPGERLQDREQQHQRHGQGHQPRIRENCRRPLDGRQLEDDNGRDLLVRSGVIRQMLRQVQFFPRSNRDGYWEPTAVLYQVLQRWDGVLGQ